MGVDMFTQHFFAKKDIVLFLQDLVFRFMFVKRNEKGMP